MKRREQPFSPAVLITFLCLYLSLVLVLSPLSLPPFLFLSFFLSFFLIHQGGVNLPSKCCLASMPQSLPSSSLSLLSICYLYCVTQLPSKLSKLYLSGCSLLL